MRQKLLVTLMIASLGALSAAASAQTPAEGQSNSPRNAPVGTAVAPPVDGSADPAVGARTPPSSNMGTMYNNGAMPTTMAGYRSARAACDQQAVGAQEKCRTALNARYGGVAPKCQKLEGSALDECLKGADTGQ